MSGILDFLQMAAQVISSFFSSIFYLITLVPQVLGTVAAWITYIPQPVGAFMLAAVSISGIYLILGRQG